MTGTSFYDKHRQTQKLQEKTEQEEMQKQIMRILGSTSQSVSQSKEDPLKVMQEAYGPDTDREKNARELEHKTQHSSTVKVRASQDKLVEDAFSLMRGGEESKYESKMNPGAGVPSEKPMSFDPNLAGEPSQK